MTGMIAQLLAWPTLGMALLVFGFAPGVVLRLIVLFYRRGNLRRQELLGELYAVPRIERPFWVAEQLEVALFEGLCDRYKAWRNSPATWISPEHKKLKLQLEREIKRQQRAVELGNLPRLPLASSDDHFVPVRADPVLADDVARGWRGRGWRGAQPDKTPE